MQQLKEKTKQRLLALFFILFFLVVYECSGQVSRVSRYANNPEVITIYPSSPMKFNMGNNDTLYVSITADSLCDKYEYKLFAYFPISKPINGYWIEIGFLNGTVSSFEPIFVSEKNNFAEFKVDSEDLLNLSRHKFDYISFNTKQAMHPCTDIKTKDYFVKFFRQL